VRRFPSSFSSLRHPSTRNLTRSIFCAALLCSATAAFAAPTVTVLSPKASSSGSPVFYEAYATSPSCASGISAMRIYTAPGVSAYTVDGAHIETFIPLSAGSYSTVVQAWDNCGGVGKTTVDITVNTAAGVSVFLPQSSSANIPVHIAASAQNPDCSAGINAIRIYTGNGIAPYTVDSNSVNTFVNLLPGTYDLTVQAWDNCGHVYKAPLTQTAVAAADGYLYAVNENNVAQFNINSGVLTNPNGSGNPPTFNATTTALSIAIDPGGWFAWVFTTNGIYGYQIDQTNGNLWTMPGSPFPLNGTPIGEPSGFLYGQPNAIAVDPNGNFLFAAYYGSNTVVSYQINRSSGAITPEATVTGYGEMTAVGTDFTGQYVYAINNESNNQNTDASTLFGYQINQNNGALTAVPGSPYAFPSNTYGGGSVSSTMLASGSPGSVLLYTITAGPTGDVWGYSVDYGTGALTAVPGSPFYADGGAGALADNQGKWVWAPAGDPTSPPQNFFDYASIESNGTLSPFQVDLVNDQYYTFYGFVEDGSGKYLYTGGLNWCSSGSCATAVVNSWTVGDNGPAALSGPLITASDNTVMTVGAAPKKGD
jgi:Lactonase, 7-bladed beta-propeller